MRKNKKNQAEQLMKCFTEIQHMMENPKELKTKKLFDTTKEVKQIFQHFSAQKGDIVIQKKDLRKKVNALFEKLDEEIKRNSY